MKIKFISGKPHYYDDNGEEIHEGDTVLMNGKEERVYLTQDECLGTDATNPKWIESGRAVPCEYGIYPFNYRDSVVLVKKKWEVVRGVLTPGGDPCYICPNCHSEKSEHVYGIEGGTPRNRCPKCGIKLYY